MKRTTQFVKSMGVVQCALSNGEVINLPVVPGLLKHLSVEGLQEALTDPVVARKYTMEALRKAPWQVLRLFPRPWLDTCIQEASLPPSRLKALAFMLHG